MTPTIAFDVYGTLIDTRSVEKVLRLLVGQKSVAVSELWRQKQLEYSFRRGLMQEYRDFSVCTRDALLFACESNGVKLSILEQEQAMHAYTELNAFEDVKDGLADLLMSKLRLFAFSNGSRTAIDALLRHATLRESFVDVLSVEAVRSFKPDPIVYEYLVKQCEVPARDVWLVSSNPFDVIGAANYGLRTVWLNRDPTVIFDPWGVEPDLVVRGLDDIASKIQSASV
ncbi:haloacid dehalogenase type II [Pseudomonas sp. URMO17WK12:I12]|uniref:haloacid dehalogenase type II n=1 Tax=Pseudomonas sp. URMO17WK12:I12 TaxID=1259797 RepID=UPI000481908C|nr:haloacid dehalogenase type II [Pseudomonas sp. URMO17WK12:I12]